MKRKSILIVAGLLFCVAAYVVVERTMRVQRPDLERDTPVKNASLADDAPSSAAWNRFRGPNGTGVSNDATIPTKWSDTENLAWKTKLPGAGASSPVLTSDRVLVTSYSGYGDPQNPGGSVDSLVRHLTCIGRDSGEIIWSKTVDSQHREDPYQGMGLPEHGYATNTPVTDGKQVFVLFGKSGVHAFDLDGNKQWETSVGTESGNRGWGSAASVILYGDLLIVNAAEESQSIQALSKSSGEVVWTAEASTLELSYGTPAIVSVPETGDELVIAVPGEIWGLNPTTGKLKWYAETSMTDNLSPSVIVDGETIYAFGGYRSSGSVAMRAGGKGDVTDSHLIWTSRNSSYVATPILVDGKLFWINDRGMYFSADAKTGELVHRARMPSGLAGQRPVYASPIAVNGKVYAQTRQSGLFVFEPSDDLEIIAQNQFESDSSVFNATPAVDSGQLFLRSDVYLYCVSQNPVAN